MVKDGIWVAAGGLRQSAETGNARAETLGPDGGQQTWKPGAGGAAGLTDAKESTQNLFRMKMAGPGGRAGAGLGAWARRLAGQSRGRDTRRDRLREQRRGDASEKNMCIDHTIRCDHTISKKWTFVHTEISFHHTINI